jgi:hypothetical protein
MTQNDKRRQPISLMRRTRGYWSTALGLLVIGALTAATPAAAAVTIGQMAQTAPPANCGPSGSDYLQTSVTGGNLYSARAAGTITSWSTNSSGAGATYVFKIFRRTSDPDAFQVVGRSVQHTLTVGVNTVPTSLHVESGDLIGLHEEDGGAGNSCTFPMAGDGVLRAAGDLDEGESAPFAAVPDFRLNLSAVLAPRSTFSVSSIVRHRRNGTATLTADLSNPGLATLGGRGLRKRHATTAVKSEVTLKVATTGKSSRKLARKGHLKVPVTVTFFPTGGDPSSQTLPLKLVQQRIPPAI